MAALKADRNTPYRDGSLVTYKVAAGAKIFAGSMVSLDGGYAKAMVKEADKALAGRAEEFVDNTGGSAGDKMVLVRRGVAFKWANAAAAGAIKQADVGAKAYAVDDQTVTKTAAGATSVGEVLEVDSDGVWVL
ncbi:MAG: hypothetical protein OXI69_15510 [Acidobacteriota bacterium]|nr:hypothetical protein [Acidobacteriota bacterium]